MKALRYLLIPCLLLAEAAPAQDILPGNWSVAMSLAMGDEKPTPTESTTLCLKDLHDLVDAGTGCAAHTTSSAGASVNMDISCDVDGLRMDGTGSFTVSPTTVDGTLNLAMQMAGDPAVQSVSSFHASRTGDCQK